MESASLFDVKGKVNGDDALWTTTDSLQVVLVTGGGRGVGEMVN